MNVWMRGRSESCTAFQAASMSPALARARPPMTGPATSRAIAWTASKSPGEAIGKPASMMSTPSRASWWAISSFSVLFSEMPGDCSPSRSVVSKISTRLASVGHVVVPSRLVLLGFLSWSVCGYAAATRYSPRRGRRRSREASRNDTKRHELRGASTANAQGTSTTLPTLLRSVIIRCASRRAVERNRLATTGLTVPSSSSSLQRRRSTARACRGPSTA